MFKWYIAYPLVGAFFLVLDMAWLRFAGPALYRPALGLTAYATYNLTTMATLRQWPLQMTLVDMAWGTVASGLAAGAASFAMIKLQG